MPQPTNTGPNPSRLPLDRMPLDRLNEVLPEDRPLDPVINPTRDTGLTGGWTPEAGTEPYLFDEDTFVILGDLSPGTRWSTFESFTLYEGDLVLGGYNWSGASWGDHSALLVRWDADTGTATNLLAGIDTSESWVGWTGAHESNLYFSLYDNVDRIQIGVVSDGQLSFVAPPVVLSDFSYMNVSGFSGDHLVVHHTNQANGADIYAYNTALGTWQGYSLPFDATVGYGGFTAGPYYFAFGGAGTSQNLYQVDLVTGDVSVAVTRTFGYTQTEEGRLLQTNAVVDGYTYFTAAHMARITSTGGYQEAVTIYRVDNVSGALSGVYFETSEWGAKFLASDGNAAYFSTINDTTNLVDIIKIEHDADRNPIVTTFDVNMTDVSTGFIHAGQLYVGYTFDGLGENRDWDFGVLNESTVSIQMVQEFGTNADWIWGIMPVGIVNEHFAVVADTDASGTYEMWTAPAPGTGSWQMISGDVHVDPWLLTTLLSGDYLA